MLILMNLELVLFFFWENEVVFLGLFFHELAESVLFIEPFKVVLYFFVGKVEKFVVNLKASWMLAD